MSATLRYQHREERREVSEGKTVNRMSIDTSIILMMHMFTYG